MVLTRDEHLGHLLHAVDSLETADVNETVVRLGGLRGLGGTVAKHAVEQGEVGRGVSLSGFRGLVEGRAQHARQRLAKATTTTYQKAIVGRELGRERGGHDVGLAAHKRGGVLRGILLQREGEGGVGAVVRDGGVGAERGGGRVRARLVGLAGGGRASGRHAHGRGRTRGRVRRRHGRGDATGRRRGGGRGMVLGEVGARRGRGKGREGKVVLVVVGGGGGGGGGGWWAVAGGGGCGVGGRGGAEGAPMDGSTRGGGAGGGGVRRALFRAAAAFTVGRRWHAPGRGARGGQRRGAACATWGAPAAPRVGADGGRAKRFGARARQRRR
ncbi:hypothetical protein FGB62_58g027 [Gracilaria domingensis]|nr:hypothetical protein FGB62_58g027 [Gracilaria domingensis]